MISPLYAAVFALIIGFLTLNVVKQRRKLKISLGDGGNKVMLKVISAHANAVETIPIFLIMLFALELNQGHPIIIHACGLAMLIGRIMHAHAILNIKLKHRVLGMHITVYSILVLVISNLVYLPYARLLGNL